MNELFGSIAVSLVSVGFFVSFIGMCMHALERAMRP